MDARLADRKMVETCHSCGGSGHSKRSVLKPCLHCDGHGCLQRRCSQCWTWKGPKEFVGAKGAFVRRCSTCRVKYANWDKKTLAEREATTSPRSGIRADGPLRVKFVEESGNRKTGPIPVSMTSARTCPTSCGFYNRGCYAEQHIVAIHWRRVSDGDGMDWEAFCERVALLPEGQIWRHNEAGDLPGDNQDIDGVLLKQLVDANAGKRGFTYTHKPPTLDNSVRIAGANALGFTINLSSDNPEHADQLAKLGIAPVVTTLPHDAPSKGLKTPEGRTIVVCPAERIEKVTCQTCGLCAVTTRKSIVGFRAHGDRKKQITQRMRQLPLLQ